MSFLSLILASLTVSQGQAAQLTLPDEPGLSAASVTWAGQTSPYVRLEDGWMSVIGIDLETEPGPHRADIVLEFLDGSVRRIEENVIVEDIDYPTTQLTVEPGYVELSPENQERAARESAEIAEIYARLTTDALWAEGFRIPLDGVGGGRNFGHRRVFNGQARAPHSGADLSASTGTPVFASNDGRVVLAKELFFSGNAVFIDHGLGIYTVYLHLSEIQVSVGERVGRGQIVGLAGATGRVTGPHLHWGARILDARIDPFSLLEIELP